MKYLKKPTSTQMPKLYSLLNKNEKVSGDKEQNEKYQQVLSAGKQIFAISINLLQVLHSLKDVTGIKRKTSRLRRRSRTTRSSWGSTTKSS